jgi:hypothetical protein
MDNYLEPTYLETDFQTSKQRLQELMENSDTFKDYNYEGANITMLLELIAFLQDNTTYFSNKIVKNIFPESSEVYEAIHSIASMRGYWPKGYVAAHTTLRIKVMVDDTDENVPSPGDILTIPAWFTIDTDFQTNEGENITYTTTDTYNVQIPEDLEGDEYEFDILIKQGKFEVLEYFGDDLVNNKLILPSYKFDYDFLPYYENPALVLYINNDPWERVDNFEEYSSEVSLNDDIFILEYDKYQRYNILFSDAHNIPKAQDSIKIIINRTLGPSGNIAANSLKEVRELQTIPYFEGTIINLKESGLITWNSSNLQLEYFTVNNPFASYGAAHPETIEIIRDVSKGVILSQNRNVTNEDYRRHLQLHQDVIKGNAWGWNLHDHWEDYRTTMYLSLILEEEENYIYDDPIEWNGIEILNPTDYTTKLKENILLHLESRKFINTYEIFIPPTFVNFGFVIGLRLKRYYNFEEVKSDVLEKLKFYFNPINRNFGDLINFKNIFNYILNLSITTEDNSFSKIRGIDNIIFRDILTYPETIYEFNEDNNYPMYIENPYAEEYDNVLRSIQLKHDQFPKLIEEVCTFIRED